MCLQAELHHKGPLLCPAVSTVVDQAVMANSPVRGRTIRAEDIAAAALFLASEAGQAVNGHTLVVDLGTISGVTGGPRWHTIKPCVC